MTCSWRAQTVRRLAGGVLLALCVGLAIERAGAQQQSSAGANVNVISGTGPSGDWTLQRQNEPSMACSSRNPQNCIAGANDYRTVDIPFPTAGEKITGDAWLGWYTTKNGGLTWRTRLLPGFPQDTSPLGLASPLRGYAAGADPVLRSGTNGLFYYGGLAFNREAGGGSAIFIARFIDNNNQEGVAGEPIDYLGASIVHRLGAPPLVARRQGRGERPSSVATRQPAPASSTRASRVRSGVEQQGEVSQLVDKPWIAVDIPRAGAQTCSVGGPGTGVPLQTFPGGRVYAVYTLFDGADEQQGRIMFSRSLDCGVTWSAPRFLSRVPSADVNGDGVATTADVNLAQASWGRSCGSPAFNPNADINNDCTVNVLDLSYVSRGVGRPVPTQPRLSQGATLAINPQTGALQVAWRQFNDGNLTDAIVTVNSANGGASFSPPLVVSTLNSFDQGTSATSFRTNAYPTMAIDGAGRAYLAWSARVAGLRPEPALDDARIVLSTSTNGTTWSAPRAVDNQPPEPGDPILPGHQIMPALAFAEGKLQLVYYDLREDVSQLFGQYVDELPILSGVHTPRLRHTIDVRAAQADTGPDPAFRSFRLSQYRRGAIPGSLSLEQLEFSPPNLPIFRAGSAPFIGDYLDAAAASPFVRDGSTWTFNTAPSSGSVFHAIWTDNRDVRPPGNGDWTAYTAPNPPFPRPAMSGFDPSQPLQACVPGQAGMRNQNIYTARITQGLVVGALTNARPLGNIQRSFPVFAQNNATVIRSYRLTIAGQPPGGDASFKQFEPLTTLDVRVPPRSTVARTVFVRSTIPNARVVVNVTQITEPNGTTVPGGQQGTIVLNPDPTNPELENPELENPELENPELENPELENPELENAEVHNPDLETASVRNPELENPELENPELENPELENATVVNPTILNPELENPELENPELENPELENPELENADLVNGSLSDTTWTLTNRGNTAGAFTVKLGLNQQLPAGFRSQLIAHKIYRTPVVLGCSVLRQSQTVLLANIPSPRFVTADEYANPELENPELENLTVALAPGETARITLRVFDPDRSDAVTFRAVESVTPVAVAQSVNTVEAAAGITQPTVAATLTSNAPVPGSSVGGTYTTALGTTTPGTWTLGGGSLPPGLTLDPNTGVITGTPTTSGTFTFTARFVSTTGLTDYRTVTIAIGAVGAAANVGVTATGPTDPVSIGTPFAYLLNVSNAGPAVATNVRVTDTLPEGTQFVGATTTLGTCQHANGTLVCNLGALASGGGATITLNVRPTVGGAHTNTAVVTAAEADPVATNNTAVSTTSTSVTVTPCATVCFSGPTSYIAGPADPEFGAEKGDFNGDGFVDLIFAPAGVNTLGIMLANGAGGFGPPSSIPIPGSPNGAAVADYNNDGHQDVVISSERTAEAWVLIGNGLGQFGAPVIVPLPTTPQNVVAADFNRDGNVDLALAGDTGPLVMILHGNGNGTFQPTTTIGTTTTFSTVVTDDVNNDTNPDLVVHQGDVGLVIVLGNGAAGFQPPTTIPITDISGVIKTGDLTGDGFADLILGSVPPTGAELHIYVGDGLGGFTPSVMIGDPALTDGAPAVGDLDSDGDLDVVWVRSGGGVAIQLNNGSGTFAAAIYLASPQVGQIIVADYNGDGRPDLALPIGDAPQSQFLVFLNTCDQPPAELAVTLTGPTDAVAEGSPFTYNIEVTNNGPNPATGVQLDFAFDPSAEFVASGGSPASCSVMGNRVTCQLGTLALGAVSTFAIDVLPRSGGTLRATAGVTGTTSDPDPANNTAFASTTVTPGVSILVVTNTNRSGPGSLYQAIVDANDAGPRDTITFNIPGPGPHTIAPTGDLPDITQPVVIDGTTQPGYSGTPLIEINGQNAGTAFGLVVNGSNSIVRGLAINRFHHVGIVLSGAGGHRLEANFIGTNTSGTAALGNLEQGVFVSSPNNVIGGATAAERNVISGNTAQGVIILGAAATGNIVSGNFIGSNLLGTARIPNGGAGVAVTNGASNNTIGGTAAGAGNLISGNAGPGVSINGAGTTGNTVAGNLIGTNAAGTAALFNANLGVAVNTGATNNTIGGTTAAARNVISGNNQSGIGVGGAGTSGNTIAGNYIGTNAAGTASVGNGNNGITINAGATNTTVGGAAAGAGNVIAGNPVAGVTISGGGTSGTSVLGNFIGTNAGGTSAVPNANNGINVSAGAINTTIGGSSAAARNIISGNSGSGVRIQDAATTGTIVRGNFVGTNAAGTAAVPNGINGVEFGFGTAGNTAGGPQPSDGNLISGNTAIGLAFFTVGAGGNQALSNLIGTDVTGTQPLGNGSHGVYMQSNGNRVGSLTTGIGNVIAFNGAYGVRVETGTGNAIVNNSIFSNGLMGIDLVPGGLTPNDPGDVDTGSNTLINFPVLSSARTVGANVLVQVALSPAPVGQFQVHFYVNAACDPTGHGEGQTLIGVTSGTGSGNDATLEASFSSSLVPAGSFVTSTMTDANGNTSEFSPCATVASDAGTANLSITQQDSPDPVTVGSPLTYTIAVSNLGPDAAANVTVTETLPANVTLVSANASIGSCSGTTTVTCVLGTVASGANVSVGIVVTPTAVGVLTTPVTVTSASIDPDTANNSVTTTTTVVAQGPLTLVVSNTNDSGAGSFRQAIDDANARQGPDTITFNIPGAAAGVRTISGSPLPAITDQVTIDGTTQPGFAGSPLIELSGANAAAGSNGLVVNAQDSVIRGLIVNRWTGSGIVLQGPAATSVVGSWIGTASDGTTAAGNGNGILIQTSGHVVGGSTAADRNVISGNTIGVNIGSASARGNVVIGNYIGTDFTGALDVGNTGAGVHVISEANTIGGQAAGSGNVISGNDQVGVRLTGGATANGVLGNIIGVNASGTGVLGNGIGVHVDGASTNEIGGVAAGAGNEIAFSTTIGVLVGQGSTNNAIFGNAIHQNGTLGIDLVGDGVTANDPGDSDEGANDRMNFPVLSAAAGGVQGTLNSFPDSTFRIEFFGNLACDASGNGEGQLFLGSTAVTTDATGNATIPLFAAAVGQFVTATATDGSSNTSEFSACVTPLAAAAEIAVSVVDTPDPVIVGGQLSYTVTVTNNGPSPATNVSLTSAWNGPFNVDASSPSGTCEFTPIFTCTFGTLQSGANATLTIVGTPGAIGSLGGTFTVQTDENDPIPGNNAVAVSTTVAGGPSTFVVSSTSNAGAGSLRQAILDANATIGADVINFAIPGAGVQTITLASPLPAITGPTTIDGTTQPGFAGNPLVELNGNGITGNGLTVTGPDTTIRGLIINRFVGGGVGISITGASATNTVVQGNFIGTNATGTAALPNSGGISLGSPSSGALIGGSTAGTGNVISGNASAGVTVQPGVSNATIQGNFIGVNRTGTLALANSGMGIQLGSSGTTVGGTAGGARNVISGNGFSGIQLGGPAAGFNTILGNHIGTSFDGTAAVPNQQSGILITNQAHDNTVGGVAAGAGNVISGNGSYGVFISDPGASNNLLQGNLIGTNAAGTAAVPNAVFGIFVFDAPNNQIGGASAVARNVISGNGNAGIALSASGTSGTLIQGNRIGTNATGTTGIPNTGHGISIQSASNNLIGGAAGNIIRFNTGAGVRITTALATTGNLISGNAISDNLQLGIDLGPDGVQPNDAGDADSGANNLQNYPVVTAASGGIDGTFNSVPNTTFRIEFFGNTACDASGNGEGATLLGTTDVTTDATGNAAIPFFAAAVGQFVTATATDPSNNTSEFSACLQTTATPVITLTATDPAAAELGGNTGTVVITRSGSTTLDRDVEVTISGTAANDGTDYTITSPALVGPVVGSVFTIRIPAGQSTATVTVTPTFGAAVEGPETVILSAEGSTATVTIADEPAVTLAATDADAAEAGLNTGTVVVTRTGPTTYDRDVEVTISGTAANDGSDFTITSPSLVGPVIGSVFTVRIPVGQTIATVTVTPIVSPQLEGPETVVLSAEGSSATVTIVDQFAPLALTVTNTNDAGAGSLRAAILAANANVGVADTIGFAIPGAGPHSIAPATQLPIISDPVTIDGTTQPGFDGTPIIELDGTGAGGTASGLIVTGGNSTIRGLVINRFGTGGPASQPPASDGGAGIILAGGGNNVVEGNYVGIDATGTLARPNRTDGIWINSPGNIIGGSTTAARNVVSGNGWRGVMVNTATGTVILGNYIGLNASGLAALGNGITGLELFAAPESVVGGPGSAVRNVISGNAVRGILISNTSDSDVRGNAIGTDATGATALPNNGAGILIAASSGNTIGDAAGPNTIAFNSGPGIQVASGTGNAISVNAIFGNGGIGINLGADAVTANDAGDADAGANNLQNFPVLAPAAGGVQATLNSIPGGTFRLEFFSNAACDASGNGEGQTFIGTVTVSADANGLAAVPLFPAATGLPVTATATDLSNNTSEFSACVQPQAAAIANLTIAKGDAPDPVVAGSPLVYTLTVFNLGPNTATDVTVTDTLPPGVSLVSAVPSQGSCSGTAVVVCSIGTLAVEQNATITITVTPNTAGEITNTAIVSAAQSDPTPQNNVATQTTTVQASNSVFTVTTTADTGAGSLRAAMTAANQSTSTLDTIVFNIPGTGPHTIVLATFLPSITDPVIIDGTTQPGYGGTPQIVLNGATAGATSNGLFIANGGSGSTIRGLAIQEFGITGNTNDLGGAGIVIQGAGGNTIERNFIGTNADGTIDLGNRADGIFVDNSPNNVIGGADLFFNGNLISANNRYGIMLSGAGTTGTRIESNRIGLNWIGTSPLGNGNAGIAIFGGSQTTIGGLSGTLNLIAGNSGPGIHVSSGVGNAVQFNQITGNGGLAIDLGAIGVTPNDAGDVDAGANNLQNFPVLTPATGGVQVSFSGQPNTTFRIDFYGNTACDASGNGEAETYFGSTTVTTSGTGAIIPALFQLPGGSYVTASATDPGNNTSELAACVLTGVPPSLAAPSPASGQQGATLNVNLTGQNTTWALGSSVVAFGAGITVNSFLAVTSPTTATANITISPTAFTGGRTVSVTTGTEVVTTSFSVTSGLAAITSFSPTSARQGDTNINVSITGQNTHFVQGVTTASLGAGVTINSVTVNSPTSATINISIEPFAQDARPLTMTTEGENAGSATSAFQILPGTPRLTAAAPGSGQQGQSLNVTVTGQFTSFVNGTTTADFGAGITVNSVAVTSATTATVNISISPIAPPGSRTITLTTGGQSASSLNAGSFFDVTPSAAAIAQISPASGRQAENLSVTITGINTHFANGSTNIAVGNGITVTSVLVTSPTAVTANLSISPSAALGARAVTATTLGEVATLANAFTVSPGVPAIATVTPETGRQAETLTVTVAGQFTGFVDGTTTASFGSGITVNGVTVTDLTHATVNLTVTPGAALGARTVVLTTGSQVAQLVGGFTVTPGQPTLFSISPVTAVQGTNATVTLNGAFTSFTSGVTTAFFGEGISAGTVTVNGPTLASVPITISPNAQTGLHHVSVTTGSQVVTLLNGFTVQPGEAAISTIDPNAGQRGITRDVSLTGVFTNWQAGITTASYGAGIVVNSNVVHSPTTLTTNITIDPGATLGPRNVVISTGGSALTVPNGFVVTDVDTTPPLVLTVSPSSGTTGLPLNTAVTVEFNEPMNRATITSSSLQLYDTVSGQYLPGVVTVDATGRVARFAPDRLLAVNRTHYVYVNNPITDVAGNHLSGQTHTFTTGFSTDSIGPTLRLTNPRSGDTNIGRNAKVTLQFDRPLNNATRSAGLRIQTGGADVPGTYVLEDGQRRVRFTPAAQLAATADYTVTLTSELRDTAGNSLTNPGSFAFTTGTATDTTAPTVVASSVGNNASLPGLTPQLRLTFNEPINPITITSTTFVIYKPSTNAYIKSTITIAADRLSVTIAPDSPLEPSTQYYFYGQSFEDLAGNTLHPGATYFWTGTAVDTTPPTMVSISPAVGATGIPVNARVRAIFSEAVDPTAAVIQLSPPVAGAVAISTDRLALTFTPGVSLSTSTTYAVQISGVRDTSGNLMATAAASFTTGASATPDTAAPTVVSFSPANAATNVAVNTPVVMTVSEPVRLGDFSTSMRVFVNVVGYGQVQMAGTYTANAARTIVTFTPSVPYLGGAQVQVYSNYDGQITDVSGNVLQSTSMTFTTAAAADTTAPTIVMVTPTDGSTGIGPNAPITLTFSEPLLPTTVSNNTFALFANGTELSVGISRSADNRTVFLSATLPLEAAITVVATGDVTDLAGNALEDFASTFATGSTFSTTRPQIVAQRPTGNGIPASASITLFSSKPLNPATLDGALYVSQGGVLVEGTVTVSGNGTAIHFDPAGNLDLAALVQVFVTSDVEDTDGNFLFAYSGSFTVTANTANSAPTVVRSSPAFYSSGSPTNAVIDIEFSEPLLASSVVSANLYVVNALSQPVAGQLTLSPDGRVVRFEPANPFAPNTYNYVYMTSGLRDLQNTPFAGTNFYFYAGAEPDDTAPLVTAVSPPEGAANVGISATIRLYVNESVNPVSVSPSTVTLASSAGVIPASVTFNTTNTIVTLVPQVPLPASTVLTLTVAGVQDRAGNATVPQTVHFTTGAAADTVQPSVIATNVTASGAANVPVNSVFQLTFDEPMDATTVLSQTPTFINDSSAGYVSGVGSMSSDGLVYTFVPDGPLAVSRQHYLSMYLGTDLAGNPQHGFSFYFSTAFTEDTTPPAVVLVNPAAGSTGVPRNARVEVRFSEPVNATSIGNVRLLRNGQNIGVTRTLSDSNRTLTLRPTIILASNASFTISVAGVGDTRGNVMPATVTSTFSTGSRTDLVVPTILSTNPNSEDSGVGVNMSGRLVFSETIDPLSVTSETFRIANAAGGPYLDATVSVAADRRSATLVPSAPLLAYTRYYLYLPSFTDVAGNSGSGTTVYFYTGAGVDTTAPTVVALSPPNGVQALAVNTRITAVMSEAIDRTSLSNASLQLTPAAAGTVTLATDRVTLTFTPSGNLSPSTAYNVLVNGLRDTAGNTMSAAAFGFTTGASVTPDTTAPTIVGRTPTANSAGVGVTSLLTISTSERITASAVGPSSVPVFAVIPNVGTYQLAGQYSVDSTGTLITFAVFGAFPANTTIQWYTNNNQSIRDMAGLPLPSTFAQFTTANVPDTNGPSVQSISPGAGATGVGPYAAVTLTFSEAVSPATVNANNLALFAGPTRLSANLSRSTDNRMVFLTATLPLDETITVVATSAVTDMSGNPLTTPFSSSFQTATEWNFTRPQVVTQRPTGSSVAPGTPITLFLNRPIDPATIAGALFVSHNGVLVAGTTTVGWSNRAVTFTPAAPFSPQALINVHLTDDARDPFGNLMSPYHGTFTIASDPAATALTLVRSNPTPYSSGNPTNVVLELEFSEPVDSSSVDSTSVFVRNQAGQPVAGQVSMRGDRVVRFVPAANFPPNEYSYIYYNVRDMQGISLSTNHYFYTGAGADTSAPSAAFVTPASGVTGVGVNAMVRVTFSEPINQASIAGSVTLSAGSPIAGTFAISSANDVITITPQLPLPVGTLVTVSINGVTDRAGNAVPITTSTFTTGNAPDITVPTVVAQSTVYGDTAVPVNSTFEVTYSEPIDAATLLQRTNVLYSYAAPGYVNGGTFSISTDARTVTYVPPANLVPGGQYSLYFDNVADMAGNVGGALSLYFTTATAEDETPPHVVATNPADGSAGVPLNARIRLAFDEPVSGVSLPNVNVLVSGLPLPIAARTLSNGDRVVTLTLGSLLAPNTAHTVSALVKDRAGNTMPAFTSTFTTGAGVDLVNLSTTVTPEPALNATGVPVSVAPAVTFNEPIDPTTVIYGGASAVWLRVAATGVQVPVAYQFSADRRRVTMVPASPLAAGTQYVISVSSTMTDVAGNSFPTTGSFGFTTQP